MATSTIENITARATARADESRPDFERLVTQEMYETAQLAELFEVDPATVRAWAHTGRGPVGFKLPGARKTRYMRADIIAWLEKAYDARAESA